MDNSHRKPMKKIDINNTIAYAEVCSWVRTNTAGLRPKPDTLEKAEKHARSIGDTYLISQIAKLYTQWKVVNETPTPREFLPPASPAAKQVSANLDSILSKINNVKSNFPSG